MLYNILQKRGVMLDSFLFFHRGHDDCKNNNSQGALLFDNGVREWFTTTRRFKRTMGLITRYTYLVNRLTRNDFKAKVKSNFKLDRFLIHKNAFERQFVEKIVTQKLWLLGSESVDIKFNIWFTYLDIYFSHFGRINELYLRQFFWFFRHKSLCPTRVDSTQSL